MKLLAFIGWGTVLVPLAIVLAKFLGWLSWKWITTVLIAMSIPIGISLAFLVFAIWVITETFEEEWENR